MRNIKKSLALVLVLAMVLTTVSGAVFSDVPTTHNYSEAIDMLNDLGILTGYSDGTYKPEGTITRAEMCAVIYRTLSGKTNAANFVGASAFSDVASNFWGVGYVNYCTELGIVNGYPDGTFLPDNRITYAEAVTMIIRALGMDKTAAGISRNLTYPGGYIAQADINRINDGVVLSANDPADRGSVAQLINNAIFDAPYVRVMDSEDEEKTTVAEYVFNIHKTKSIIIAFEEYGVGGCDSEKFSSRTLGTGFFDRNFNNKKFSSLDKSWIGKQAEIYYNDDEDILAIVEVSGKNEVVTVPASGFYQDGAGGDFKYKISTARTIDITTNAARVVQNGETIGFAGDTAAGDALLADYALTGAAKNENRYTANITLLSNDGTSKTIEYIFIDEYVYGKVGAIEKDIIFINSLDGSMLPGVNDAFTLGTVDYSSIDLYDDDDDPYDIDKPSNLKKDMKVLVYKDQNSIGGDRSAARIIECPATEAEFSKLSGSNYTIGSGTYKPAFAVTVGGSIGDTIKIYVDGVFGYIVESDATDVNVTDLYFIKDIGSNVDAYGSTTYFVKTVNSTGATREFTVKTTSAAFPTFFLAPTPVTINTATIGEVVKLKVNASNRITGATLIPAAVSDYNGTDAAVVLNNSDEFKAKTTLWKLNSGKMWTIADDSLIFYIDDDGDASTTVGTMKTYKTFGGAPVSKVYYNNDDEVIAAVLNCNPKGASSATSDIYGYVSKYTIINVGNEKAYAELTIAANGKVQTYDTETVDRDDIGDIRTNVEDTFVQFDLTSGGKVVFVDTADTTAAADIQVIGQRHHFIGAPATSIATAELAGDETLIYGYQLVAGDAFSSSKFYVSMDGAGTSKLTIADNCVVYNINRRDKTASVASLGTIQKSNASYDRFITVLYDGDDKEVTSIWYESYKTTGTYNYSTAD